MTCQRAPLMPGHVRRLSPTVCLVEPLVGSTDDDIEQLRWLGKTYTARVPFATDWSLDRWAQAFGYLDGDVAAMVWVRAYERRLTQPDRAKTVRCIPCVADGNLTIPITQRRH